MSFNIKTLDKILADMDKSNSAKTTQAQPTTKQTPKKDITPKNLESKPKTPPKSTTKPNPPTPQSKKISDQKADNELAYILSTVTPEPLTINDKKTNRLRWLAFYYLSRRELSKHELRQKLLAKEQDPDDVEDLLIEFAKKGYQSDERCAYMLIRESLRKGRGKQHIKQLFKTAKLDDFDPEYLLSKVTEDIADGTILEDSDDIDWLKLAVEARCKKYGNSIPKDPKEKARQLRFLQYRGFEISICFDALKKTLDDFDTD